MRLQEGPPCQGCRGGLFRSSADWFCCGHNSMWHGKYYQPIDLKLFVASYQSVYNLLTFFGRLSLQNALGANRDFSQKIWYFRRRAQRKFCFDFNERREIESCYFDSVPCAFYQRKMLRPVGPEEAQHQGRHTRSPLQRANRRLDNPLAAPTP